MGLILSWEICNFGNPFPVLNISANNWRVLSIMDSSKYMKCILFPMGKLTDRFHETYKGGSMSTFSWWDGSKRFFDVKMHLNFQWNIMNRREQFDWEDYDAQFVKTHFESQHLMFLWNIEYGIWNMECRIWNMMRNL